MTSKQSALWGNIIASLTFVITAFRTLIFALFASDIIANTAFVKGIFISMVINLILQILTWIAYVKIDKRDDKGYIDVVFLNKTNDAYDKLVSTNKDEAIETAKKAFVKDFKDSFMDFRPSDEQASAAYNQFREVQAKRSSYKLTTVGFYDSKALVNVKLEALSRNNIRKIVSDYETAYLDATDDYDYKKAEEDAFNKYKEILDKSDLVESSDKLNISMTKKDGKWDIKMKNVDGSQNEYLLESYIGHVMDY